jgi:hypothetical protein
MSSNDKVFFKKKLAVCTTWRQLKYLCCNLLPLCWRLTNNSAYSEQTVPIRDDTPALKKQSFSIFKLFRSRRIVWCQSVTSPNFHHRFVRSVRTFISVTMQNNCTSSTDYVYVFREFLLVSWLSAFDFEMSPLLLHGHRDATQPNANGAVPFQVYYWD